MYSADKQIGLEVTMKEYKSIREKIVHCSPYGKKSKFIEVDITPCLGNQIRTRRRKNTESAPKQKLLNTKRAVRYLFQLIKCNFTENDYSLTLTYKGKHMPKTDAEVNKMINNYIERVNRVRLKAGLPKAKYICVNEYGKKNNRIHHHILISGGLDRNVMESLWCARKKKGEKKKDMLGYANCDRLQFTQEGIEGLSVYLAKDMQRNQMAEGQMTLEDFDAAAGCKGKRHWKQSKGLIKPWHYPPNEQKYKKSTIEKLCRTMPPDCENVKNMFERIYRGYQLDKCEYEWNEYIGRWSIYLKMHLIT